MIIKLKFLNIQYLILPKLHLLVSNLIQFYITMRYI
jgi:hypothetical protein